MTNTDNTTQAKQIITNAFNNWGVSHWTEKSPPSYDAYVEEIKSHLNAGQIDRAHTEADNYVLELAKAGFGTRGF